jgi:hypothetical protein
VTERRAAWPGRSAFRTSDTIVTTVPTPDLAGILGLLIATFSILTTVVGRASHDGVLQASIPGALPRRR